jgi:hypothetical protein
MNATSISFGLLVALLAILLLHKIRNLVQIASPTPILWAMSSRSLSAGFQSRPSRLLKKCFLPFFSSTCWALHDSSSPYVVVWQGTRRLFQQPARGRF